MIIREATSKDIKRLSYLIRKNIENVHENRYSPIQISTWSAQNLPHKLKEKLKIRKTFCAFEHNKMMGTISIEENLVCGMYVSYSQRGRGIGQMLLHHIEKYASKAGIKELILTASPNGYGFYLKNGYKPNGPVTIEFEGIPYPETNMKKTL